MQGVSIFAVSIVACSLYPFPQACCMDVQIVSIYTILRVDVQCVCIMYIHLRRKQCGVECTSVIRQQSRGAGCIPLHRQQYRRAGCILFQLYTTLLMPECRTVRRRLVRYRNEKKCRCRKPSGTGIREPSPVSECSGTGLRCWVP
jgi:hypothetical protein